MMEATEQWHNRMEQLRYDELEFNMDVPDRSYLSKNTV